MQDHPDADRDPCNVRDTEKDLSKHEITNETQAETKQFLLGGRTAIRVTWWRASRAVNAEWRLSDRRTSGSLTGPAHELTGEQMECATVGVFRGDALPE